MRTGQTGFEAQRKLSKVNADFLDFVEKKPDTLKASSFNSLEHDDKLHRLQSWPTFVNRAAVNRFREAGETLFQLIKSIPGRIFGNDVKKISAYYEIPRHLAEIQLAGVTHDHIQHLVARGDFMWASSGLKCLEYNVSANLGGWSVPIWESLYLKTPVISEFLKKYAVKITNKNLIRQLLEHIVHAAADRLACDDSEMNIVFVTDQFHKFVDTMGVYLNDLYKRVLIQENRSLNGEVFICDYPHLDIVNNHVYYRNKKIHALTELNHGLVSPGIFEVFKAGTIRLMNGPITPLLSSKLNLALLSDYKAVNNNIFNDEEKKVIDTYVPWSRKMMPENTTYGTEDINLENFVLANKDKLVIKPSLGYGGNGVYVGRNIPRVKWQELIKTALRQKSWLVQEFVETSPALYRFGEMGAEPHDVVWGFFVLGSRYAGAWARVLPTKDNKQGIINCHQGARVSVIFEVDE